MTPSSNFCGACPLYTPLTHRSPAPEANDISVDGVQLGWTVRKLKKHLVGSEDRIVARSVPPISTLLKKEIANTLVPTEWWTLIAMMHVMSCTGTGRRVHTHQSTEPKPCVCPPTDCSASVKTQSFKAAIDLRRSCASGPPAGASYTLASTPSLPSTLSPQHRRKGRPFNACAPPPLLHPLFRSFPTFFDAFSQGSSSTFI